MAVAELEGEAGREGGLGHDGANNISVGVAVEWADRRVDGGEIEGAVAGELGDVGERDEIARVLIVDVGGGGVAGDVDDRCAKRVAGGQLPAQRGAHGYGLGENRVAREIAILAADLEILPRLEGGGDVHAGVLLAVARPKETRVTLRGIDPQPEHPVAGLRVQRGAPGSFGVCCPRDCRGGAAVEVGALGGAGDRAAGIAGAEEQGV